MNNQDGVIRDAKTLGIPKMLLLGLQHMFAMFGATILVPILINGYLEASYPSSTTLLVLSVMPSLKFQADRRIANSIIKRIITVFVIVFSSFMVAGRLISGVHWATDIIGSVFLSSGLYYFYKFTVACVDCNKNHSISEASDGIR